MPDAIEFELSLGGFVIDYAEGFAGAGQINAINFSANLQVVTGGGCQLEGRGIFSGAERELREVGPEIAMLRHCPLACSDLFQCFANPSK